MATWAASPQPRNAPPAGSAAPATPPVGATFNDETVRMVVRTSIAGKRIRLRLSNVHGANALRVGATRVALRSKDSEIVAGSSREVMFNGKAAVTIPAGSTMISDALDFDAGKLADVAISLYLPSDTGSPTMHGTGLHTTYVVKGDQTNAASLADARTSNSWYFLAGLDVMAPADAMAIVAFGDSITDGATSTPNTDHSWPSLLAKRLQASEATSKIAIVNQGISGNRLLRDGTGSNALARFDRDVLAQPGVKWVTLMEGINDIGQGTRAGAPAENAVTLDELIGAQKQFIERAHSAGLKVVGATLTPYEGAAYYSEAGEKIRAALNQWIRTSGAYDAVVDFDAVIRDPEHPLQFKAGYNIMDHLHPNDAGYEAMASAVDLSVFTKK